jgi:DNA repair exonuclease SbcCD ATPase subunit
MKTKKLVQRIGVVSILIIALLLSGLSLYNKAKLKKNLSDARLKSEILLSEKLSLNKSIVKFKIDIDELEGKNSNLRKTIADINQKIKDKSIEIEKLTKENASIKTLKKKNNELEKLSKNLNQEIAQLNKLITQINTENKKLNDQLASSSKTNSGLLSDNSILKAIISDNYRTEALRGKNERLTVNANRTNKLLVSFDLPGNITDNIYFKVVTPQGKELSSNKDMAATIQIIENGDGLLASSSEGLMGSAGTKRVEMAYKPNQKLSKGIYQFNIYNGEHFLGSTQMRLK